MELDNIIAENTCYIESCIDKLYDYFRRYGYEYFTEEFGEGVMDRSEIRETITDLINSCIEEFENGNETPSAETGRILVSLDKYKTLDIYISL